MAHCGAGGHSPAGKEVDILAVDAAPVTLGRSSGVAHVMVFSLAE